MTIGQKIKLLREEANLTQQDVADALFLSRQTISNWERNHIQPMNENLQDLTKVLNIDEINWNESTKKSKATINYISIYTTLLISLFIFSNISLFIWLSKDDLYRIFGGKYYLYEVSLNLLIFMALISFTSIISLISIRFILQVIKKYNL